MNHSDMHSYSQIRTHVRREILVVLSISLLCAGLYSVLAPFLVPLAWGMVVALSTWPLYARLERRFPQRPNLTASLMTASVALILLLLVVPIAVTFTDEVQRSVVSLRIHLESNDLSPPEIVRTLPIVGEQLYVYIDRLLHEQARVTELWRQYQPQILQVATWFAAGAFGFLVKLLVTLFIVFFLYRQGREIGAEARRAVLAIGGPRADHFIETFRSTVRGTVYGVMLTAIAQGFLAGFGFAVVGAPFPVLFGFATFVLSFVPLGPPFLYLPIAAWIVFAGAPWWHGVLLAGWGVGVVSMADNILRPIFISQATNMSILLVVFSVIGGILQFGLIGLFIGPVLMALALTLWREWLHARGGNEIGRG